MGKKKSSTYVERPSVLADSELANQYHRDGERSLLHANSWSDISHPSLIQELHSQGKIWLYVLLMMVGSGLVYFLMHPHPKA